MNKQQIINEIYTNDHYNNTLNNICKSEKYRDDLKQEIFMILLETDDDKIIQMYNEKTLIKYFNKLLTNHYKSKTSSFYRKYKKKESLNNTMDDYTDQLSHKQLDEDEVKLLHFNVKEYVMTNKLLNMMEMELFIYYYDLGESFIEEICDKRRYRELAKALGFAKSFIQKEINNIRYKILKHMSTNPIYSDMVDKTFLDTMRDRKYKTKK